MRKLTLCIVLVFALTSLADAHAEVFSQSFAISAWNTETPRHYYVDVPVNLGASVTTVDSIWVEISGVSHVGSYPFDLGGGIGVILSCRDLVFISFIDEQSQGQCGSAYTAPDGIADCVAWAYTTNGPTDTPFTASSYLSGIEWSQRHPPAFDVLVPRPDLGSLFSDGVATLRLQEIDAGGSTEPCVGGLADIGTMTIYVAYNSALPAAQRGWGSIKALYR